MSEARTRTRLARLVAMTMVGAVIAVLLPATAAQAADPLPDNSREDLTNACPAGEVPDAGFTDTDGTTFEQDINCLAWYNITQGGPAGLPDDQYGPALDVRRDQMASFIARAIDYVDPTILGDWDGENDFSDVGDENTHLQNINRLADAGVVQGGPGGAPDDEYGPELDITRAQMASFIARAIELIQGGVLPETGDYFDDDENAQPHEANINRLAGAGIVQGRADGVYAPFDSVRREAMAAFIMRMLDFLVEDGTTCPPSGKDETGACAPPDGPGPDLVSADFTDEGDGVFGIGDVITLTFEEPVTLSSLIVLEDGEGESVCLSDEDPQVEGCTDSDWELSEDGLVVTITVTADPIVHDPPADDGASASALGVLDGPVTITESQGINDAGTGEPWDPSGEPTNMNVGGGEEPTNRVTVTPASTTVQAGSQVRLTVTGEGIQQVSVSGPCLATTTAFTPADDVDPAAAGIQFDLPIGPNAAAGSCALTVTTTFTDGSDPETDPLNLTITRGASTTFRPELISAQIISTTQTLQAGVNRPAGTVIRFGFDEAITAGSPQFALFHAYRYAQAATPGGPGAVAQINGTAICGAPAACFLGDTPAPAPTTSQVDVLFGALTNDPGNPAAEVATLSLATVDLAAVRDSSNLSNPEGDAAIGAGGSATLTTGRSSAPDATTMGGFRQVAPAPAATTAIDFGFDQNAFVQGAGAIHVITVDNIDVPCNLPPTGSTNASNPSGLNAPGGNGTMTITVLCGPIPGGIHQNQPLTTTNIVRGIVDAGTVGTQNPVGQPAPAANCNNPNGAATANFCNPLMAADAPRGQTNNAPDLQSVTLKPATNSTSPDEVTYTFDAPILATFGGVSAVDGTMFFVYRTNGQQISGGNTPGGTCAGAPVAVGINQQATACGVPQVSGSQVIVFFPNGTLANVTGGSIDDNAVRSSATTNFNQEDETGVTNPTSTTITPGRTQGPDLTSVLLTTTQSGFNNNFVAVYLFDTQIGPGGGFAQSAQPGGFPANASRFHLYLDDTQGSRLNCVPNAAAFFIGGNPGPAGTAPTNAVICAAFVFDDTGTPDESGTNTGAATSAQIGTATLGTVDNDAITDVFGRSNPEGAEATSGGTGTQRA